MRVEHSAHGGEGFSDGGLGPAAGPGPFQAHVACGPRDPDAGLAQSGPDDVGGHGGIHHQRRLDARVAEAGFAGHYGPQRDSEDAQVFQVQPPGKRIGPAVLRVAVVQGGKLVDGEAQVLREVRDDSIRERVAVQNGDLRGRAGALLDEGLDLLPRRNGRRPAAGKTQPRGAAGLVQAHHDVTAGNQLLRLEGVRA